MVGNTIYWVCREAERKKCEATAVTIEVDDGVVYIKKEAGEHTHS